jgi:hypothetical protein
MKEYKDVYKAALKEIIASEQKIKSAPTYKNAASKFNITEKRENYFKFSQGLLTGKFMSVKKVANLEGLVRKKEGKFYLEDEFNIKFCDNFILGPVNKEDIKGLDKSEKILISGKMKCEGSKLEVHIHKDIIKAFDKKWDESKFVDSKNIFATLLLGEDAAYISTRTVGKNTWFNTAYSYCPNGFVGTFDEKSFEDKPKNLPDLIKSLKKIFKYYVEKHEKRENKI